MSPQEKIIEFMKAKQKRLDEVGITSPRYFTKEDENTIKRWDNEEANEVWKQLKFYVKVFSEEIEGLTPSTCPFCINYGCGFCPYGERHGECDQPYSDYTKIYNIAENKGIDMHHIFDYYFYEQTIKKIESKNKGGDKNSL